MSDDVTQPAEPASGPEHDAWLREALRHAPDAAAAPPLLLREAILAEARAAARVAPYRSAPSISFVDRFAEFWSWLARPPVAAGFASVMAATLVGLMWWDRPMDEAMPQPPAPSVVAAPTADRATAKQAAEAQAPTVAAATKTATAPAAPAAPTTTAATPTTASTTAAATGAATPAPTMPAAAPQPPAPQLAARLGRAAPEATLDRALRPALPSAAEAPAERDTGPPRKVAPATDLLRETSKDERPQALKAAPAAAPTPFPARDRSDPDAHPVPMRPEPAALAKRADKTDREEKKELASSENRLAAAPAIRDAAPAGTVSRASGVALDGGASGRFAEPAPPAPAASQMRQRSAAQGVAPARPMAPLLAALGNETERWSRSAPGSSESVAVDAAAQAWLASVDAAASQWNQVADPAARRNSALASTGEAYALLLNRAGRLAAIVRIDDGGVVFESRPGLAWFAPLAPDVVSRLRATLPAAAR